MRTLATKQRHSRQHLAARNPGQRVASPPSVRPGVSMLGLQRTVGNQAVERFLQRDGAGIVQAGQERLRGMANPNSTGGPPVVPVQLLGGAPGSPSLGIDLATSDGGKSLPADVRGQMENSFDTDFSGVRVHVDGQADDLGAKALTTGDDIHFASDTYDPTSAAGRGMLGHELTHVVQQREGRISAPEMGGNATVVQDSALEAEADQRGARAATSTGSSTDGAQQGPRRSDGHSPAGRPVVQGILPAIKAMGAAIAAASAADKAAIAGAIIAGVSTTAQVGSAISPGSTGVQTYNMEPWNTAVDRLRLEQIIQFRLINAHVEHWRKSNPGVSLTETTEEKVTTTTTKSTTKTGKGGSTTTGTSTSVTPTDSGPAAPDSAIDDAVRAAIGRQVELDVLKTLNKNQKSISTEQYIWSDSGDHTADTFGTVGSIQFQDIKGTVLEETLTLSDDASKIPNLVVPGKDETVQFRQFRGARLERGEDMETGWNDDLGINLVGGAPTKDEAENDDHGKVTFTTEWNWDDNTTHMDLGINVHYSGEPYVDAPKWRGEPED